MILDHFSLAGKAGIITGSIARGLSLAPEASCRINGHAVFVDGGWLAF